MGLGCREEDYDQECHLFVLYTYPLLILKSDGFPAVSYTKCFKICHVDHFNIFQTAHSIKIKLKQWSHSCCADWNKNKKVTELNLFTFRGCMYKQTDPICCLWMFIHLLFICRPGWILILKPVIYFIKYIPHSSEQVRI